MRPPRTQQLLLVVDDSPTGRRVVCESLRSKGYEVIAAEDGEQALDLAFHRQPDLVVLDIVLPKKNGFQVCRQLKAEPHTKHIRVVLLSSKILASDRQWGMKQGADAYITKPFEMPDLLTAVEGILARDGSAANATPDAPASPLAQAMENTSAV